MKVKLTLALTLALVMLLALVLALGANAQEPTAEPLDTESSGEISGQGLTDPVPAGFSMLYMFTGVNNVSGSSQGVATTIHCTNFDTKAISLTIQLFKNNGTSATSRTDSLNSNETGTYSTQSTFFNELPFVFSTIQKGSGRVLATTSKVICTAQLVEPGSITPTFVSELEMFKP
ncbi:MAG: hypothetical protein Fur0044_06590 [Anaerolineae bacterium]